MRWIRAVVAIVVAVPLVMAPVTHAQAVGSATVVPIQITGDPAKRFSMVVLGDGYTAAEMPKFRAHLDKHLNILWSIEPFRSYRSYINVYAVEIVSGESGITCDPEIRQPRNTPLGMQFGGGCTNINARGITIPQEKQALTREYAAKATPHFDQILVIANTDTYGGIGGSLATTSGGNSLGPLITPHELGHSLGRLGDEYTYSARGKPGGAYTGAEPASPHMTLMSIEDMLTKQAKWFRWMGEPSESGGRIERFEGGSSRTTGIWRPSKHSMMISVGYYFDQPSREQMVRRISAQVDLIADATPASEPVPANGLIWLDLAHPVYHELTVSWSVDGRPLVAPAHRPYLNLVELNLPAPKTVAVTVVDDTPFVRDPEIRKTVLTATRTWRIGPAEPVPLLLAAKYLVADSTQTSRPVGGRDVIYLRPAQAASDLVEWRIDDRPVDRTQNMWTLPLATVKLTAGTHTVSATVSGNVSNSAGESRQWTVDNTGPTVAATLSTPVASIAGADADRHYFMRDEFTMKLDASDDQPGYVVAEFRVNGDGWHHYYGWPDALPGTPYKFTPRGTTIKELVYGSLSAEGLSPQPWEPREPGWGTHRIEYRGIDAAGNIGASKAYRVTFMPSPTCTETISGPRAGNLTVTSGTTCLDRANVTGTVTVSAGASLVAVNSSISGGLTAANANAVELVATTVGAALRISGTTGALTLFGSTVATDSVVQGNKTARPALLAGNTFRGALSCTGNSATPVNGGTPNTFTKAATGQCLAR